MQSDEVPDLGVGETFMSKEQLESGYEKLRSINDGTFEKKMDAASWDTLSMIYKFRDGVDLEIPEDNKNLQIEIEGEENE